MFYQIKSYLTFWLRSSNQHGVHSPFVYNLITKCFYDNKKHDNYKTLKKYRTYLKSNTKTITITDLGSGSRVFKTNKRSISSMAKNAGASTKETRLLYRLSKYFKFKNSLELGTSLGIATQALQLGNSKNNITTIEGCPNISAFTKATFKQFNLNTIKILTGDFKEKIKPLTTNNYDLIYFDGNHQKQATLYYFETLLPTATNDSVFIFDDIYWSKGMTEAWHIIKKHPKVTVTIDTFSLGFVFFRQEQAKEHFTVRL